MTDQADTRALIEALRRITGGTAVTEATHAAADALEATLPTDDEREALVDRIADEVEYREVQAGRARVVELARRSPAPPVTEETEWEYAEFDADDMLEDGTIHEWAEPRDVWPVPLSAEELAELRAEGRVYARRPRSKPWCPVPAPTEEKGQGRG